MMLWLLCALLAVPGTISAQFHWCPPGQIVVNVVSRDLSPVPGAAVSLYRGESAAGEPVKSAVANAGGHVEFRELAAGPYVVTVRHPGSLGAQIGPIPVEDKSPPPTRIPEILAVLNPVMVFSESGGPGSDGR